MIIHIIQEISDSNGCDLLNQVSFKLTAIDHSANPLYMILQRLELRTHPYQKYALPIKLKNLNIFIFYLY